MYNPQPPELGIGAFGRCLDHENEGSTNGINALTNETPQSSLALLPCEDTEKVTGFEPGGWLSPHTTMLEPPSCTSQPPEW